MVLTPEEARRHPQRNLITRALGTTKQVQADLFRETVEEDLPGRLVLDLSGLSFMDSSGIALVMGARQDCMDIGAEMAVRGASGTPLRIFQAAGIPGRIKFE